MRDDTEIGLGVLEQRLILGERAFGLLQGLTVQEVRGYIEQLSAAGLLRQVGEEYPVLALTPEGSALLKDEGAVPGLTLARQRQARKDDRRRSVAEAESWEGVDRDLFDQLRAVRLRLARAIGLPLGQAFTLAGTMKLIPERLEMFIEAVDSVSDSMSQLAAVGITLERTPVGDRHVQ